MPQIPSKYNEKSFQAQFTTWAKQHHVGSAAWELKIEKGNAMRFDRVAPHQVEALQAVTSKGLFHKIQDMPVRAAGNAGFMRFSKPKPFDCFALQTTQAFVVILFYRPRKPKTMLWIAIDRYVAERDSSAKKSLSEDRAKEISNYQFVI